ncbi:MAG: IS21 family transposase [Chryseolinea sp.]
MSLLSMHQIRRIIELQSQDRSIRETVRLTGLSRNTIREYVRRISLCGMSFTELMALDDKALTPIVYVEDIERNPSGRPIDERHSYFQARIEYFGAELRKRGVTRYLLWQEYRREALDGYSYSQFCEHLSRHMKTENAVMHFSHVPGEQLQVDFAGDKLGYVDVSTGELILCEVLVCVLPYSHYVYVEALTSQRQEDFITGLRHGLEFIGGVPQSIKCDNMRTAVVKANRYEPTFTEAMEFMAAHYGTTIMAARVKKPRDKASVEKAVDLTYKHIYAPLRHITFHNLEQLNEAIRRQITQFNARPFKVKQGSRIELFLNDELPTLKELPTRPYEIKHVTYSKVQRNYHVIVGQDRHQYSVPYTLIGKRVKVIYTSEYVEIYDDLKRIALHGRSYKKNGYTTTGGHMPSNHQHVTKQRGWNDEYFLSEAKLIGVNVSEAIARILKAKIFHEQSYTSCLGILRLGKQYGNVRLEAACQRALSARSVNYGMVASILKNGLDKSTPNDQQASIPSHDQLRGPQAYL